MTQLLLGQASPEGGAGPFGPYTMPAILGLFGLFWVIVILPASRRQKREQQALLNNIKRGTKVVTSSGIIGTVVAVKENENEITIRSEDSKLRILRSTITQVLGSDEKEAAG